MRVALQQPGLRDGEVVFGSGDGVVLQASQRLNLFGRYPELPMASLTKPLVAEEVRKMIERGDFSLDASAVSILGLRSSNAVAADVTLRQLIQHQAGFDRYEGDPLFAGGVPDCTFAAEVALARGPELEPGKQIAYSNAGYCVLGEILKLDSSDLPLDVDEAIRSPLGAAGGWRSSLPHAYQTFIRLLPIHPLSSAVELPDGSYYGYAWRHWSKAGYPEWSHFGRLPGIVSIAASDGKRRLLMAFFEGDPADVDATVEGAMSALWACMPDGIR